jgi:hypothetical protein
MMRRRPSPSACAERARGTRRCRGATGSRAVTVLLRARRTRSACRVREDFTGRGFGSVRLRESR